MTKAIWTCEYKLKKNANEAEFLAASEVLGKEYISKQKGYISWQQIKGDSAWVDLVTWETTEDAKAFETSGGGGELAERFYSFINLMSCKSRYYTIEQDHSLSAKSTEQIARDQIEEIKEKVKEKPLMLDDDY